MKTIYVTPPPVTLELDCSLCHYKLTRYCRICHQERLAEKLGDAMLSKLHPDKETYTLMRGR